MGQTSFKPGDSDERALFALLFPTLKRSRVMAVNLDGAARSAGASPAGAYVTPQAQTALVEQLHRQNSVDFSLGGYFEDRSYLLSGSYLDKSQSFLHAGIDLNVPEGTPVYLPFDVRVIRQDDDFPAALGWGPRLILESTSNPSRPYIILAHFAREALATCGSTIPASNILGTIGGPPQNGNWFPHLHIQLVAREFYQELLKDDLRDLDGYVPRTKESFYRTVFPDPQDICNWG